MKLHLIAAAVGLALAANAHATDLSGSLTADNQFSLYISTSNDTLGEHIVSGNNWGSAPSFSGFNLVAGQNYFLHVVTYNWDYESDGFYIASGFLGNFALNGSNFSFANGSQTLLTNTADWKVAVGSDLSTWVTPTETPISFGQNGVQPWGYHAAIDDEAQWIWQSSNSTKYALFSTAILAAVPEPSSYALLLAGIGVLGAAARRSRKA
ncbi:PEP-CTERM sorting domain-containing protein [Methylobacillus glycogenes]|uniref:PEP-CTERM sorting domain-containing protein n=1 Tax=Methylobacillus glycogenes TaxID=406 RepID=UPI000560B044|nr:PEP-CTERM sorting domain-containing protein [Methylobacillus glycogenes]